MEVGKQGLWFCPARPIQDLAPSALLKRVSEAERKVKWYQDRFDDLKSQNEELSKAHFESQLLFTQQLRAQQDRSAELERQFAALKEEHANVEREITARWAAEQNALNDQLKQSKRAKKEMQKSLEAQMLAQEDQFNFLMKDLQRKLEETESDRSKWKERVLKKSKTRETAEGEHRREMGTLQNLLNEARATCQALQQQQKVKDEIAEDNRVKLTNMKLKYDALREETVGLKIASNEKSATIQELERRLEGREIQGRKGRKETQRLKDEIRSLRGSIEAPIESRKRSRLTSPDDSEEDPVVLHSASNVYTSPKRARLDSAPDLAFMHQVIAADSSDDHAAGREGKPKAVGVDEYLGKSAKVVPARGEVRAQKGGKMAKGKTVLEEQRSFMDSFFGRRE
ncbi:hypothetical protein HDV00_012375 [Rhizophlyctis rosea]|nr:hypothetical protein HDV00_012375 [Rhizophlyctis rosea]